MAELDDLLDDITGPGWHGRDERYERLAERIRDAGLDLVGHAEADGGVGGTTYDAATIVARVAQAGGDLALTERLLMASHVVTRTGLRVDPRTCTVAIVDDRLVASDVAGLRDADTVLLVSPAPGGACVARLMPRSYHRTDDVNLAGEPRDTLRLDGPLDPASTRLVDGDLLGAVRLLGALGRACQIVGALRSTLNLTVEYTAQRHQFGRPLLSQQLVQAHIAEIAAQLAATEAAVAAVFDGGDDLENPAQPHVATAIAAAKFQASAGAAVAARLAHQVTGAMGMTREYPLGHLTSRLWAWSEEFGSSSYWAQRLASIVANHEDLWSLVGAPATSSLPSTEERSPCN